MQETAADAEEGNSIVLRMAKRASDVGDFSTAITVLTQAWRTDQSDGEIAAAYADTLIRTGNAAAAVDVLNKASPTDETRTELKFQWSKAQLALGHPELAVPELNSLLAGGVEDFRIFNALGVGLDMLARHDEAVLQYRKASSFEPNNASVANNLGLSMALNGRFDEGITILRGLAEGPNSTTKIRQNLALAYGLKGELSAAKKVAVRDLPVTDVEDNLRFYQLLRFRGSAETLRSDLQPKHDVVEQPAQSVAQAKAISTTAFSPDELTAGKAPGGEWYLNLGRYASAVRSEAIWRILRKSHPQATGGLTRLSGAGSGLEPLLVGPVQGDEAGKQICSALGQAVKSCNPLLL